MEENKNQNIIQGNTFNGVHWDADAVQTVQTVATALLNLTELFKSQNVTIDAMIKVSECKGTEISKGKINEEEKD